MPKTNSSKPWSGRWSLGLMSGTSLDGIDAALIQTDGLRQITVGPELTVPYDSGFRARLQAILGGTGPVDDVARELTLHHSEAVRGLLSKAGITAAEVAVVGFHGHTILHEPAAGRTWQIGDAALLSKELGIDVVADFRSRDVAEGGQGAPFAPLYHAALAATLEKPLAVLNVGGVANVTWIGDGEDQILAFDTGPGNALINDWVEAHNGQPMDRDGLLAAAGCVNHALLEVLLGHPYFALLPPKSLDRDDFDTSPLRALSLEDGAATLTAFTAAAIARGLEHLPASPRRWLVTGGGRHNPVMMSALAKSLAAPVEPVEAVGWHGDALEAQAFAYLAVRSLQGLPLSLPTTTGVRQAVTGGTLYHA